MSKNLHFGWPPSNGTQDLLDIMNIPSLADHILQLKLPLLYKIVHGMCYFPSDILCPRTNYSHRTNHSLAIDQPYACTNAYFYSFVPHTIGQVENAETETEVWKRKYGSENKSHVLVVGAL